MTFEEALATQPQWVQYWINWMGIVIVGTMITLLFSKTTWRDAALIFATSLLMFFAMNGLYERLGLVRILGIVHVLIWTPLLVYFWYRLNNQEIGSPFRQVIWVFMATVFVSLVFDYADVARYILGERDSMIPST